MFSSNLFERLFTLSEAAIFVWGADDGWPVEYVSPSVERLLGYSQDDLLSGAVRFAKLVHPEDLPSLVAAVARGDKENLLLCPHEPYRLRHADGHWLWVHDETIIERAPTGRVTHYCGYVVDMTEHKQTALKLKEQRDRLELVLEGTRLGMWDWYPQTNKVVFDERWAEMLGHRLAEIEPSLESWESRVHPDDLSECYADIQAHLDGKVDFYQNVHRMKHKDGHWVYILDRGRVCEWDAEGKPVRFSGTHTDITAEKTAEIEAREASRAKTQFLARMSHEIRTPLNGVLGTIQLLEGNGGDDQQTHLLRVIRDSGEALLAVINDVLDVSKIEAGELAVDCKTFDVRKMLTAVHDLYAEKAVAKKLAYFLQVEPEVPPLIVGDAHRIRQILSNYLSNALKFTSDGGVTLRCAVVADAAGQRRVRFEVRDSGPGIANPQEVWEPFRQADVSVSRQFGGTGLGLAICRQLAELMGGAAGAESQLGNGATFFVELALEEPAREQAETIQKSEEPATLELPTLNVLVAEDNSVNQLVIGGVLKRLRQNFHVVRNGVHALRECQARDYDLVLMDIHMPEMNGMESCRQIRETVTRSSQPQIIALSADTFASTNEAFKAAQFDGIIAKPFKVADIAEVIRQTATMKV